MRTTLAYTSARILLLVVSIILLYLVGARGLLLLALGIRTATARTGVDQEVTAPPARLAAYGSTLVLTLTNPMTIFMFAAIFTSIAPSNGPNATYAALLVQGALGITPASATQMIFYALLLMTCAAVGVVITLRLYRWGEG